MHPVRLATALTTTALASALVVAAPAEARPQAPETIAQPAGGQPQGKTTDRELLAPGAEGRTAVGIDHDRTRDVLWVAGGPTAEVRAQDADTGEVLATYTFPGTNRFLNDLVVTRDAVYVTDSNNQELAVIPLGAGRALPAPDAVTTLPLTGDLVYSDGFNLNGIVAVGGELLAVQSNTGTLFRIDPSSGDTAAVDLGGASLSNGDGVEVGRVGRTVQVFVVRNRLNLVADVRLDRSLEEGTVAREIGDEDFQVPTTVALVRDALYAVNARFGTPPTPETEYDIVRVGLR